MKELCDLFRLRFEFFVYDVDKLKEEEKINDNLVSMESVKIIGIDFLLKILIFFFVIEF